MEASSFRCLFKENSYLSKFYLPLFYAIQNDINVLELNQKLQELIGISMDADDTGSSEVFVYDGFATGVGRKESAAATTAEITNKHKWIFTK